MDQRPKPYHETIADLIEKTAERVRTYKEVEAVRQIGILEALFIDLVACTAVPKDAVQPMAERLLAVVGVIERTAYSNLCRAMLLCVEQMRERNSRAQVEAGVSSELIR